MFAISRIPLLNWSCRVPCISEKHRLDTFLFHDIFFNGIIDLAVTRIRHMSHECKKTVSTGLPEMDISPNTE